MRDLMRPMVIVGFVLLVPVLPFLAFGSQMESWIGRWRDKPPPPSATAGIVVGLLSTDIFLPIPSSVVSTLGGWQLGWLGGTAASWLGMSLGAVFGFALARRWGRPLALRFATPDDLARMESLTARYGPGILAFARGVPVLAEASVLLVGVNRLSWGRFLVPVLLSNLGVALAYSAFGEFAERHQWMPLALGISIALPVLLATVARRWFPR